MASYYLTGYMTPNGVNSREKVKEYQNMLGVTADGVWGPKTQEAYEQYSTGGAKDPYIANADAFGKYYDFVMSKLSVPGISVKTPSRAEIEADYKASLRPGVELAIDARRKNGEAARAEMDADAASRGMSASTYVSSMKEREGDDVEDDITSMEAQYTATLAERISSALQYYSSLEMQAAAANASMAASASSTAVSLAAQWYQSYINGLQSTGTVQSKGYLAGGRSTGKGSTSWMTTDQYYDYIARLSASERQNLFKSNDEYWITRRNELQQALGADYEKAKSKYTAGAAAGGGAGRWLKETR